MLAVVQAMHMVSAAEIRSLDVDKEGARIEVRSEIVIDASPSQVFGALSDYDEFAELSSRYLESRYLEPGSDGTPRVYTKVKGCVLFFCQTVERVARLTTVPDVTITAEAEPELSDVKYGLERWELEAVDQGTMVAYHHSMEPDFWVPPLIGLWALRRMLQSDALSAAERIEQLALDQD